MRQVAAVRGAFNHPVTARRFSRCATIGGGALAGPVWDEVLDTEHAVVVRTYVDGRAAALIAMIGFVHGGLCPDPPCA
jgi:hypothetical protein